MDPAADDDALAWELATPSRPPVARPIRARLAAATWSGVRGGLIPGAYAFAVYFLAHRDVAMPWLQIASVLALYAPGVATSLAILVELAVIAGDALRARVPWLGAIANAPLAVGLAGALAGIAPGAVGVVVFGGYRGPFAGTWLVASALSAAAIATALLGAVALVVAPLLVAGAFAGVAGEVDRHGALVGGVVGALGGGVLGIYIGVTVALARAVATRAAPTGASRA